MAKQNKKPARAPEALSFMDLICKVGDDTVASMRQDLADGKFPAAKKKASKGKKA